MKLFLSSVIALMSFNAFSSVSLYQRFENRECWIRGNEITITTSMMKGELTFTEKKTYEATGLEDLLKKAASLATGRHTEEEYQNYMTLENGEKVILHHADSVEANAVIKMMGKLCN